eukprot:11402882-Heterocapsa_arctica.AAC.1
MTRVCCTRQKWASTNNKFGAYVGSSKLVPSSDVVQNDQRSARNVMVIARMPEDRSTTFNT